MSVFSLFKKQVEAAKDKKRIVFPESDDLRILTAVSNLNKDGIVEPILIVQLILSLMKRLWLKLVINQHKQLRWLKLILK